MSNPLRSARLVVKSHIKKCVFKTFKKAPRKMLKTQFFVIEAGIGSCRKHPDNNSASKATRKGDGSDK